jgi:hypothetical protein
MHDSLFATQRSSDRLRFNGFKRERLENRKSLPWMTLCSSVACSIAVMHFCESGSWFCKKPDAQQRTQTPVSHETSYLIRGNA